METRLHLDEKLVADVVRFTGEEGKSKAVTRVLEDYVRAQRLAKLRSMLGNLELELDDWREFRSRERA